MYDLVLYSIPKMGLIAPSPGCSLAKILRERIPNHCENDGEERHLVGPELLAELQWLIYSALFKSLDQGARGDEYKKYYTTWVVMFKSRWGPYCKLLLKALERDENRSLQV